MLTAIAILGIILQLVGFVPYIVDIFRGKTKPERASFWIFTLLIVITIAAQLSQGLTWATVLLMVWAFNTGFIALLSIKYGYGTFKRRDFISVLVALVGVALWWVTDQPLIAALIVVAVDFAGFWLTLAKTWVAPHTETLIAWLLSGLGAVCALAAAGTVDPVQISYLLYSAIANLGIVWMILYRRKVVDATPVTSNERNHGKY